MDQARQPRQQEANRSRFAIFFFLLEERTVGTKIQDKHYRRKLLTIPKKDPDDSLDLKSRNEHLEREDEDDNRH